MRIASDLPTTPAFAHAETIVVEAVRWVHLGLEAAGALIVAVGAVVVLSRLAGRALHADASRLTRVRLGLARSLTLALEFQLAADVLATAIAPSWQQIGRLSAIAVIRTALNYSLAREIASERKEVSAEAPVRKSNMSSATP